MPDRTAILLTVCSSSLMLHIISTYSALAKVVMSTSAMGEIPILPKEEEEKLLPPHLFDLLIAETRIAQQIKVPVNKQYRMNYQSLLRERSRSNSGRSNNVKMTYEESFVHRHPDVDLAESSKVEDLPL